MARPYTTISEIKAWIGIEDSVATHDTILTLMRDSVEQAIINYVDSDFDVHTVVGEILDGNGSDMIITRFDPIQSVQAIYFYGKTDGTEGQLIDPYNYHVISDSAGSSIVFGHLSTPRGRSKIRIDYTYGYDNVPPDVIEAILLSVEAKFRRKGRKSIGIGSRSKKDESESYNGGGSGAWDAKVGLPKEVISMLSTYRKIEFPARSMATRNP